ncbi:MAG TPA: hypothetical protein VFM14_16250 [Gemmatimonadales bacterium]|nr:hypothetical protein [Gemmatimonadales bacterium]
MEKRRAPVAPAASCELRRRLGVELDAPGGAGVRSWQVVPTRLVELISDQASEQGQRAMAAMRKMKKIDIAAVERAYNGQGQEEVAMIFGIAPFTLIHVLLSLVGIFAGLVVAGGLVSGRRLDGWTGLFLVTTLLTNVTGFFFPFVTFLPSHAVGIISLLVLPVVFTARYWKQLSDGWRGVYVIGAVFTLYLNAFVLVVQLFRRMPALIAAAPTQKEPPFLLSQLLVLALFVWLGRAALKGFRTESGASIGGYTATTRPVPPGLAARPADSAVSPTSQQ